MPQINSKYKKDPKIIQWKINIHKKFGKDNCLERVLMRNHEY